MQNFDGRQIGQRIRDQRQHRGLGQGELALAIGVRQATLSRLECGHSAGLRASTLHALAVALGCTADYLLGLSGEHAARENLKGKMTPCCNHREKRLIL